MDQFFNILEDKKKLFVSLLIISPLFWLLLTGFSGVLNDYLKIPEFLQRKIQSYKRVDNLKYVDELRWETKSYQRSDFLKRAYYNKATLVLKDIFNSLSNLSPKVYFSGEKLISDRKIIEPLPFLYLPFWFLGIASFIRQKKIKLLSLLVFSSLLATLFGNNTFPFLIPVGIIYVSITAEGLFSFSEKKKRKIFLIFICYSLFLFFSTNF